MLKDAEIDAKQVIKVITLKKKKSNANRLTQNIVMNYRTTVQAPLEYKLELNFRETNNNNDSLPKRGCH